MRHGEQGRHDIVVDVDEIEADLALPGLLVFDVARGRAGRRERGASGDKKAGANADDGERFHLRTSAKPGLTITVPDDHGA